MRRTVACALAALIADPFVAAAPVGGVQDTPPAAAKPTASKPLPVELPDGPVARAYASSPSTGASVAFPTTCPPNIDITFAPDQAWRMANTWRAWACLVSRAAQPEKHDVQWRAALALLALEQKRWDDAWMHFAACDTSKEWMSALLPSFLPGVPAGTKPDTNLGSGAVAPALPDGVVLRPSLPPPSDRAEPGRLDVRAMKLESFVVGKATLSMRVSVEVEGVQIDIEHRSGGEARLSIVIPVPIEYSIGNEYVDWSVQPTHGEPLLLEVKPGDESHTIYGRFEPRTLSHPTRFPDRVPAQITGGSLWLLVPGAADEREFFATVAASLSRLPLHLECRVISAPLAVSEKQGANQATAGVTIDLSSPDVRHEKLAWLVSSIERFVFAPDGKRPR